MIVKNISKTLGQNEILTDVSFKLNKGDKVGLIGINGSGKTTLLKILSQVIEADGGQITGTEKIGYLKQEISIDDYNLSILEFLLKDTGIGDIEQKMHILEEDLNESNMDEYDDLLNRFLICDGYNFEENAKRLLNGLKLEKKLDRKIAILSGGEKNKVLLASMLLGENEILLLDEPTNNLDIASINYLEQIIKESDKTFIIVSHDELFLKNVTTRTIELLNGRTTEYPYSYDIYLKTKEEEYKKNLNLYEATIEKQKELQAKLQQRKNAASRARSVTASDNDKIGHNYSAQRGQVKSGSAIRRLTKEIEQTQVDPEFRVKEKLNFTINGSNDNGSCNISIKDLVCGYSDFRTPEISLDINYGDRLLVFGQNGTGKSTFLKSILNKNNIINGNVQIGSGVKIGYIEQNTITSDNSDLTLYEYITNGLENVDKALVFQVLKNFQISYEDKDKPFYAFSAGQRTKINLAKLSLNQVNTLFLDEPTNHLDIEASNILYEAIDDFDGIIIAVSHNKTLCERLNPNILLDIKTGRVSGVSKKNNVDSPTLKK